MDNLTHSLFGFSIAEATLSSLPEPSKKFSRTVIISSVVANNFPDLDFIYAPLTHGKLGYLIHHRGHTHTILMAFVFSALWLLLDRLIQKRHHITRPRCEQWCLAFVIVFGFFVHIGLDSLNSYGVRPFWPLDNSWHYGDSVFIIEPWLWVALLPTVIFSPIWFGFRGLAVIALMVAVGFCWRGSTVPTSMAIVVSLTAVVLCASFYQKKNHLKFRSFLSLGSAVTVILLFIAASTVARSRFYHLHDVALSQGKIEYVALSPMPANPYCWTVFTLETEPNQTYVTRRALFAPFPKWFSVDRCPTRGTGSTLRLSPIPAIDTTQVRWLGEWQMPLQKLRQYNEHNCEFATFLKFARFPYVLPWHDHLLAGDFRFDWETRLSFAEMLIPDPATECPQWVPPWVPPTEELLESR